MRKQSQGLVQVAGLLTTVLHHLWEAQKPTAWQPRRGLRLRAAAEDCRSLVTFLPGAGPMRFMMPEQGFEGWRAGRQGAQGEEDVQVEDRIRARTQKLEIPDNTVEFFIVWGEMAEGGVWKMEESRGKMTASEDACCQNERSQGFQGSWPRGEPLFICSIVYFNLSSLHSHHALPGRELRWLLGSLH